MCSAASECSRQAESCSSMSMKYVWYQVSGLCCTWRWGVIVYTGRVVRRLPRQSQGSGIIHKRAGPLQNYRGHTKNSSSLCVPGRTRRGLITSLRLCVVAHGYSTCRLKTLEELLSLAPVTDVSLKSMALSSIEAFFFVGHGITISCFLGHLALSVRVLKARSGGDGRCESSMETPISPHMTATPCGEHRHNASPP